MSPKGVSDENRAEHLLLTASLAVEMHCTSPVTSSANVSAQQSYVVSHSDMMAISYVIVLHNRIKKCGNVGLLDRSLEE